jgi:hypothetical protein
VAAHQSAGSCSDQSGRGREMGSACSASPRSAWASSTRTALTAEVPMSRPRKVTPFL